MQSELTENVLKWVRKENHLQAKLKCNGSEFLKRSERCLWGMDSVFFHPDGWRLETKVEIALPFPFATKIPENHSRERLNGFS